MAEFVDVMKQARRLCEEQQYIDFCVRCPMQGKEGCMVTADAENIDYVEAERKIMGWAAEHPEPVYPSWIDAWQQLFSNAKNVPCPELYFGADCTDGSGEGCIACKRSPIPAVFAEKLGIRPKEK